MVLRSRCMNTPIQTSAIRLLTTIMKLFFNKVSFISLVRTISSFCLLDTKESNLDNRCSLLYTTGGYSLHSSRANPSAKPGLRPRSPPPLPIANTTIIATDGSKLGNYFYGQGLEKYLLMPTSKLGNFSLR